uniref:Uncharacterized protein n=1 Tax=Romanomermis culicivorax TaxID=13658 RepID=A0A915KTB4_ROMCU
METIVVGLCDEFPEFLRKYHRHVLALCAVIFYAFGVPFCTKAGLYAILIFENYLATWSLLIIAFVECMALAWVYDVDNLLDNIKWMIGYYPAPYIFWKLLWLLVTPTMLILVLTYAWIFHEGGHYVHYRFPLWADTTGWILSFMAVSAIPLTILVKFILQTGSLAQRFRSLLTPEDDWGPALAIYRSEQYPLQIPEARDPLKLPWVVAAKDRNVPVAAADDVTKPFISDENDQKRFERETAI